MPCCLSSASRPGPHATGRNLAPTLARSNTSVASNDRTAFNETARRPCGWRSVRTVRAHARQNAGTAPHRAELFASARSTLHEAMCARQASQENNTCTWQAVGCAARSAAPTAAPSRGRQRRGPYIERLFRSPTSHVQYLAVCHHSALLQATCRRKRQFTVAWSTPALPNTLRANPSLNRTRNGRPGLGLISFWPKPGLPLRSG